MPCDVGARWCGCFFLSPETKALELEEDVDVDHLFDK